MGNRMGEGLPSFGDGGDVDSGSFFNPAGNASLPADFPKSLAPGETEFWPVQSIFPTYLSEIDPGGQEFWATPSMMPEENHQRQDESDQTGMTFGDERSRSRSEDQSQQTSSKKRSKRSTTKDSKVTERNRLAQQRFRHRQRQKLESLSSEVDRLQARVNELEDAESDKADLNRRLRECNRQLREVQRENDRLRHLLAQNGITDSGDGKEKLSEEAESVENIEQEFKEIISWLHQEYQGGFRNTPISSLEDAVVSCLDCCARFARAYGAGAGAIGLKDQEKPFASDAKGFDTLPEEWLRVANQAEVDERQRNILLSNWEEFSDHMQELFSSRKKLEDEVKHVRMQHSETLHVCSQKALQESSERKLMDAVARLRENLSAEMRMLSGFERKCFLGVLHPWQAATIIVELYPRHIDACAFCSALQPSSS